MSHLISHRPRTITRLSAVIFLSLSLLSCADPNSAPFNENNSPSGRAGRKYLYVASGSCYAGGATVSTGPSNAISKFNLTTGQFEELLIDYNQLLAGDQPVAIADFDADSLLVLVQNTSGRRIDWVKKDGSQFATFLTNSTALTGTMRDMELLPDYSILVSKSTAVEKFNAGKSRLTIGVNPYINAPAAPCATSTTMITSVASAPNGMIVYTHAAASPNNKIGVISATGYAGAANCKSSTSSPTTTSLPTRAIFHSSGKLLVSYGSATAANNSIYSYDFNDVTGTLSNATAIFNDAGVVNGPSTMTEDVDTGRIYVASAQSAFNTIERFDFDGTTLSRDPGPAFISSNLYTRCVADLLIAE